MAGSTPFVLPQFQGSMYDLQRQQALANALMQGAMTQQQMPQATGSGQYTVMPHMSPLAPLSNIAQGLLANKVGQEAGQNMNSLGQQQWQTMLNMMTPGGGVSQSPQLSPDSANGGGVGGNAVANPFDGSDGGNGNAGAAGGPVNGVSAGPQLANNVGGSPMNPLGMNPGMAAMMMMQSPDKYWEAQAAAYKPNDFALLLRQSGIDPQSAIGRQLMQAQVAKLNAPTYANGRPGGFMKNTSTGEMEWLPAVPQGGMPVRDAAGNFTGAVTMQPGAAGVEANMAAAKAGGEGSVLPYSGFDQNGNPLPVTNRTAAATQAGATTPASAAIVQTESNGNPNAVSPKGAVGAWQVMPNTNANPGFGVTPAQNNSPAELNRVGRDYYNAMTNRYGSPTIGAIAYNMGPGATDKWIKNGANWEQLPQETRNYVGKVSTLTALNSGAGAPQQPAQPAAAAPQQNGGAIYASQKPGYVTGQDNLQNSLDKKWNALSEANGQAQNTISYLQNIRGLASKAALGQQSDKINFVNGLLSLAGSEKATDAVTANNLLDKYSNQIVARLGQGGLGTDAARSILQSAYPNSHMTLDAINEASDNLVGASQMTQAKARLLQGDANARNPQAYNQKEMVFDQNADPRIWQFQNMNPQQRQAFKASMTPEEQQQFGTQIRNLAKLGVLK